MNIYKDSAGFWILNIPEAYPDSGAVLDKKSVQELIDELNKAACNGAPWGVYEESTR